MVKRWEVQKVPMFRLGEDSGNPRGRVCLVKPCATVVAHTLPCSLEAPFGLQIVPLALLLPCV